jgi:hypothetical protein
LGRFFEAESVAFWSKQSNFSFLILVGLEAFETLDAVVEGGHEGVDFECFEGSNFRCGPSFLIVEFDDAHVVTVVSSEEKDVSGHLWQIEQLLPLVFDEFVDLDEEGSTLKVRSVERREKPLG